MAYASAIFKYVFVFGVVFRCPPPPKEPWAFGCYAGVQAITNHYQPLIFVLIFLILTDSWQDWSLH